MEAKRIPGERNPFRKLLHFDQTRRDSPIAAKLLEGGSLRQLWVNGLNLKKELDFIREQFPLLEQGIRPEREFPGLVPYSSRRFATQLWPTLYRKHIAPLFTADSLYQEDCEAFLKRYERLEGAVHYIGLLVLKGGSDPRLSTRGQADFEGLKHQVGAEFVHFRALAAEPCAPTGTRFRGLQPPN